MATPYITIGCPTTGGGVVQEGDDSFLIEGIPIACVGHKATCPLHKTVSTIISGDQYFKVGGKPAARAGDGLSCGCKLLPKQSLVVGDNGGGMSKGTASMFAAAQQKSVNDNFVDSDEYGLKFQLIDEDANIPVSECFYLITIPSGEELSGITDENGFTQITNTGGNSKNIDLHIFDFSKPMDKWV